MCKRRDMFFICVVYKNISMVDLQKQTSTVCPNTFLFSVSAVASRVGLANMEETEHHWPT